MNGLKKRAGEEEAREYLESDRRIPDGEGWDIGQTEIGGILGATGGGLYSLVDESSAKETLRNLGVGTTLGAAGGLIGDSRAEYERMQIKDKLNE